MAQAGEKLEVRLHGQRIGELTGVKGNGFTFQYDQAYVDDKSAPPLGAKGKFSTEPWSQELSIRWFDGLLPEGERRSRFAEMLGIVVIDTWTMMHKAGAECAGAVQIVPEGHKDNPRVHTLNEETLHQTIRTLTRPGDPGAEFSRAARMSLAGAQEKIVLHRDGNGEWGIPAGGHPSTHILKPQHGKYARVVENEHWCMTVSRYAGVDTAKTWISMVKDTRVLVVERYDRVREPDGTIDRIHQEDLAQALGSWKKYQSEGGINNRELTKVQGVDGREFFNRLILNWLIGNCDAHAKNYSVLEPGTEQARLAPVYDLVSTEAYPDLDQDMGTAIGKAKTLKTVEPSAIEAQGRQLGMTPCEALERAANLASRLRDAIERANREGIDPGPVPTGKIERRIKSTLVWAQERYGINPGGEAGQEEELRCGFPGAVHTAMGASESRS